VPEREGPTGGARPGFVDLGDEFRPPGGPGQPHALREQQAADPAAAVLGVHRHVEDRHGPVVLERQQQPQGSDDGAVHERRPVGAVPRSSGRDQRTAQGRVIARRPRLLVGTVGPSGGRPHLAPDREEVVVGSEFDQLRERLDHASVYRPSQLHFDVRLRHGGGS
jgi:hypothetical protein